MSRIHLVPIGRVVFLLCPFRVRVVFLFVRFRSSRLFALLLPSVFRPRTRIPISRHSPSGTFAARYMQPALHFIAFSGSGFKPEFNANAVQLKKEPLVI